MIIDYTRRANRSAGKVGFRKLARAGLRGFGAAALGSLLYYGVRAVTGYELGLVAIVVGYLVGNTVRKAAGGRGGWQLQALAMFLTYTAIVSTYVPVIYQTMISMAEKRAQPAAGTKSDGDGKPSTVGQETSKDTAKAEPAVAEKPPSFKRNHPILRLIIFLPLQFLLVFGIAMVMPILAGAQNIIGLFIIGIALYQAWKINKKIPLTIEGPLRVGGGASGNLSAAL